MDYVDNASQPRFSLLSLTRVLAYLQRHAPPRLATRRLLTSDHLRHLAAWVGLPNPALRTVRSHPLLAAHLAALHAANLLDLTAERIAPTPETGRFLRAPRADQLALLHAALANDTAWQQAVDLLTCPTLSRDDYRRYLHQQLDQPPPPEQPGTWLAQRDDEWQLALPDGPSPHLLFDLLQLGDWSPGTPLRLTPRSIAAAGRRGMGLPHMVWTLSLAADQMISPAERHTLARWLSRGDRFRLETVTLLSAADPADLDDLLTNRGHRRLLSRRLSPRHAIVDPARQTLLARRLAREGYFLDAPDDVAELPADVAWLGVAVLQRLARLLPLPVPAPRLAAATPDLDPARQAVLTDLADAIVEQVQALNTPRDDFFPSLAPPPEALLAAIEAARRRNGLLYLHYQPLGAPAPGWRAVQPLRIAQRETLVYLHAYCTTAQRERTFRLDRVHAWRSNPPASDDDQRRQHPAKVPAEDDDALDGIGVQGVDADALPGFSVDVGP